MAEPLYDVHPVIVGVRGTDHDLYVRIDPPKMLDGLQAIPAGRHPHVDECHAVGVPLLQRLSHLLDAFLTLVRRVDGERGPLGDFNRLPEKSRFRG
jgi:hypothetical protein